MLSLLNERTQASVADIVEVAYSRQARRRGLLGRDSLDQDAALVLCPCLAIHTAFMRFPIDVVFVDGNGYAVHMVHNLQPWRIAGSLRARAVIELAAGRLKSSGVALGDRLFLTPGAEGMPIPAECPLALEEGNSIPSIVERVRPAAGM